MKKQFKILTIFLASLLVVGLGSSQLGAEPELQEYRQPDITVDQEANTVTSTFYLENTGGSFANIGDDTWIIEIQPQRQTAFSFLSTAGISAPDTCDDSKPKNVHKEMVFQNGERKIISLTSPLNGEGSLQPGEYSLRALTVTGCATGDTAESNVQSVDPYGWGTQVGDFTVEEESTDTGGSGDSEETVWIAYSNSDSCVEVTESDAPSNLETYDSKSSCVDDTGKTGFPIIPVAVVLGLLLIGFLADRRYDILG